MRLADIEIHNLLKPSGRLFLAALPAMVLVTASSYGQNPQVNLKFQPSQTTVSFTLGDTVHTVHGAFALKRGQVTYSPSSGEISGEVVVDATTGHTGNGMRDRKMHEEIIQSLKYPDIIFRPNHVDGNVGIQGTSNVQIHGILTVHGDDHEITVPLQVELAQDHWMATGHFVVPYVKWGMKNPSTFILRVSESVEIDVHASGTPQSTSSPQ
jgi:polyisoprenoid-binding protein YceI